MEAVASMEEASQEKAQPAGMVRKSLPATQAKLLP